ncbi:M1-specific T cell receptor beta chain [Garra rufa]|uniref:M1-specific T cell receptor beta chain n=1 Tax=Garra rufa TaxID=137080 RepID=UPI003CCE9E91
MKAVIIFTVTLISFSDFTHSYKVDQSPPDVIQKPGESAKIQCSHRISRESSGDKVHQMPKDMLVKAQEPVKLTCSHTIRDYDMILWYEQVIGDVALSLIGYVRFTNPSTESPYTNQYNITGDVDSLIVNMKTVIIFTVTLISFSGFTHSYKVDQSPPDVIQKPGESAKIQYFSDGVLITQWPKYISNLPGSSVEMHCYQNDTDYNYKFWYRQIKEELVLIGSYIVNSASNEKGFENGFEVSSPEKKKWTLKVDVKEGFDAVYLCAAIECCANYQAYFGNGTKLTVLEHDFQPPNVTILQPSGNELGCKDKVTLVCVASGFYPDHVSITWIVGGKEITDDVATDPYATKDEKTFNISSRLKVLKKDWRKESNKFMCNVSYYETKDKQDFKFYTINGIGGGGYEPEDYLSSSKTIMLAYGVFIAKSALYGLVILVFVWRKGSSGK